MKAVLVIAPCILIVGFGALGNAEAPPRARNDNQPVETRHAEMRWLRLAEQNTLLADWEIPVLTVLAAGDNELAGELRRLHLRLERASGSQEPLSVAVSENVPGGAGSTLRSSVWLAAVVAGLLRYDDLRGVTLSVRLSGQIDGPSAGGMICLAILAALVGTELPNDFAFTGTILPDGSIGRVDGIAAKLTAAKAAGIRRVVIPAFLRFEQDTKTGEYVDLKRLARSLNIELVPAENLRQAYYSVYRLSHPAQPVDVRKATTLPDAVEDVLVERTQQALRDADSILGGLSKEIQLALANVPLGAQLLSCGLRAKCAQQAGQLFDACDNSLVYLSYLRAYQEAAQFCVSWKPAPTTSPLDQLKAEVARRVLTVPDEFESVTKLAASASPLDAQLLAGMGYSRAAVQFEIAARDEQTDEDTRTLTEAKPDELPKGLSREQAIDKVRFEAVTEQLYLANLARGFSVAEREHLGHLLGTLGSDMPMDVDRAQHVESFFFAVSQATRETFTTDIVPQIAQAFGTDEQGALSLLLRIDMNLPTVLSRLQTGARLHERVCRLKRLGTPDKSITALATQVHAVNLAALSGAVVRWLELDARLQDDGSWQYGRPQVLSSLLRTARDSALANLAACQECRIPCPGAIACFQVAEMSRDDSEEDKVDVLVAYWQASLSAQVLRMLFGP